MPRRGASLYLLAFLALSVGWADLSLAQPRRIATELAQTSIRDAAADENIARCGVCRAAVAQTWHAGDKLRRQCIAGQQETEDCFYGEIKRSAVDRFVRDACDLLPRSHQALIADHGFDMLPHDTPDHDAETISLISTVCKKWLHSMLPEEEVASLLHGNLVHLKHTHEILQPLQRRFCQKACDYPPLPPRKRKPQSGGEQPHEMHIDHSYSHRVEQDPEARKVRDQMDDLVRDGKLYSPHEETVRRHRQRINDEL